MAVLNAGGLVDLGTHEELTLRCPLYRLLLAGPGDDAEGVDTGELAYYETAPADVNAPIDDSATPANGRAANTASATIGRGMGIGGASPGRVTAAHRRRVTATGRA